MYEEKVKRLTEMGFSYEDCRRALEDSNWDEETALRALGIS